MDTARSYATAGVIALAGCGVAVATMPLWLFPILHPIFEHFDRKRKAARVMER